MTSGAGTANRPPQDGIMIWRKRKPYHPPRTSPTWKLYIVRFELDGQQCQEVVEAHSREEAYNLVRHFWGRKAKVLARPVLKESK